MSREPEEQALIDALDAEIAALRAEVDELHRALHGDGPSRYAIPLGAPHGALVADAARRCH
jgi:hypothetical protein